MMIVTLKMIVTLLMIMMIMIKNNDEHFFTVAKEMTEAERDAVIPLMMQVLTLSFCVVGKICRFFLFFGIVQVSLFFPPKKHVFPIFWQDFLLVFLFG